MKPVDLKTPEIEQDAKRDDERKTRMCLVGKVPFLSEWPGERICRNCKSRSNWRSGFV